MLEQVALADFDEAAMAHRPAGSCAGRRPPASSGRHPRRGRPSAAGPRRRNRAHTRIHHMDSATRADQFALLVATRGRAHHCADLSREPQRGQPDSTGGGMDQDGFPRRSRASCTARDRRCRTRPGSRRLRQNPGARESARPFALTITCDANAPPAGAKPITRSSVRSFRTPRPTRATRPLNSSPKVGGSSGPSG